MAGYHPSFTSYAFAAYLFIVVTAQPDLSGLSCPEKCSRKAKVSHECISYGIIGCTTKPCRQRNGTPGYICTRPTPVPSACPAICKSSKRVVRNECREFHFLRCAVETCRIPNPDGGIDSLGYNCADPTPTPTACTDACRGTKAQAERECKKVRLLGCIVNQCVKEIRGRPDKLGYSCSMPTPTPTSCPNVCMEYEIMSRQQCRAVAGLGLGCKVQPCAGGRGFLCGTPLPSPSPSPPPPDPEFCPSRCRLTDAEARAECTGPFVDLGCDVRPCRRLSAPGRMGFACILPTPTPEACPDTCSSRKKSVEKACDRVPRRLGCEVLRCDRGFGKKRFACTTPTPTPTACPGVCFGSASLAVEQCAEVRGLGLDCTVARCAGPEGAGFSCGTPVIPPMTTVTIDGVHLDEDFKFNLNLTVEEGAGVSKEDIYLLTDATGSMREEISIVRSRFSEIVAARTAVSDDVMFGVGFYRDEADGFDNGFNNLQSLTGDTSAVQAAINSLRVAGGGDAPEANLVALYRLATEIAAIGWRDDSRKIVVMLGDQPGHEPTCVTGAEPLTRTVVADALNDAGITLVAVSFNPGLDRPTTPRGCGGTPAAGAGQATFIATNTGGRLVSPTLSTLISTIMETIGELSLTIEADTSDCDGVLTSTYDPPLPVEVEAGTSTTICQVISLLPGVCHARRSECKITYSGSGAPIGMLTVRTSNIKCR